MDGSTLDVNRRAPRIVECHGDLRRVANSERLSVRDRLERNRGRELWRRHATVLHQKPRRVETGKDRLLLLGWRRGNARILAREIIPDNALSPKRSLPLRFVLRAAVGSDLLIRQSEIRVVLADVDRDRPILRREPRESIK